MGIGEPKCMYSAIAVATHNSRWNRTMSTIVFCHTWALEALGYRNIERAFAIAIGHAAISF
jgi:hypothetical protein